MTVQTHQSSRNILRPTGPEIPRSAAISPVEGVVRAGAISYDRDRDLPALIRTDPFKPAGDTVAETAAIVARLERALRAERARARAGHWTYDLNRHIALRQAYRAETERLAILRSARSERPAGAR